MTPRRTLISLSVLVAIGVLGLSACSSEKPSGLAAYKPSPSGNGAPASPTTASKWTPEQQQVIDGYDGYNDLVTKFLSKAEPISMTKIHKVATEPFATTDMKEVDATLSAGFVETGEAVNTISSVTVAQGKATIKTCLDLTKTKLTKPSAPPVRNPPPSLATVSLSRQGELWLVAGLETDEGACVSG